MKCSCSITDLREAITQAHAMTTRHANLPVLQSVFMNVSKETGVTLRATNLSIGIEARVAARVEIEGVIALDGGFLSTVLGTLDGGVVELFKEDNDSTLHIHTNKTKSFMKTVSPEDFPELPDFSSDQKDSQDIISLNVEKGMLLKALRSVIYAALGSDTKPEISSVYITSDANHLTFVSTDSYRLAEKKIPFMGSTGSVDGIMIPAKNIHLLMKVLETGEENEVVQIQTSSQSKDGLCVLSWKGRNIATNLIEGAYPDYHQIIPQDSQTQITLLKSDVINALRVLNVFADKYAQVDLQLATSEEGDKTLTLSSQNLDKGKTDINVQGALEGEDISMRFNARYVQDCLASISTESLIFLLNAANRPLLIKPIGDASFQYLVMPLSR